MTSIEEVTAFVKMATHPHIGYGFVEIEARPQSIKGQQANQGNPFHPSEVISLKGGHPFRLMVPENCVAGPCRWIYAVSFGGGLVADDSVYVKVKVGDYCAAVYTSQGFTKAFHCRDGGDSHQHVQFTVGHGALLCVLMDPVVCYRDARFIQSQVVKLASASSNLVFLDWMLSGRQALDEHWDFTRYKNSVEIRFKDEKVQKDSTDLEDTPLIPLREAMGGYKVFGTCIIVGPDVAFLSKQLGQKYGTKRNIDQPVRTDLVVSHSTLCYTVKGDTLNGCYIRFLAHSLHLASEVLHDISGPLNGLLGDDPFKRKL